MVMIAGCDGDEAIRPSHPNLFSCLQPGSSEPLYLAGPRFRLRQGSRRVVLALGWEDRHIGRQKGEQVIGRLARLTRRANDRAVVRAQHLE